MFIPLKDYNPTRRPAVLVILLILLNFSIFIYQSYLSRRHLMEPLRAANMEPLAWPSSLDYFVARDGLVPAELVQGHNLDVTVGRDRWGRAVTFPRRVSPPLSLVYSLFMHGSWLHLLGNMLFLWIFGNNIEDRLGRVKFVFFYLLCGIGASLAHVLFNLDSLVPVIGASGAVSGVMGAYLALFPTARVRTLVFVFIFVTTMDIPAAVFLVIWFLFQFLSAGGGSGIAWLAHVGGFILGFLLVRLLAGRKAPVVEIVP
ncbi:MAG: rhomboid family intramembrane serine protease [Acidobacteria bacterium]|jgi:membrane associated rhomboid family serine protease|nr:rhomboid family intramembrane serine protease [Acidobacteriota bacterium]